jgi:hypothetical protein
VEGGTGEGAAAHRLVVVVGATRCCSAAENMASQLKALMWS